MIGLEPWDQSDRQKQTKVEDMIFWTGRFWAKSKSVKKWWKVIAEYSKLNRQMFKWRSLRGEWIIRMRNFVWCRKLVLKMRWSMSERSINYFEWWWWFDESDIWWRSCVVTVRRLNRYKVIEIQWLSGIENFVSERDDFIFNSFRNFKPVKRFQNRRNDVLKFWSLGSGQQFYH